MQTKDTPETISMLPPPPAPPSRDANPWEWPEEASAETGRRGRGGMLRRVPGSDGATRASNALLRLGVALGIAALVLAIAVSKGFGHGGPKDWVSVMFPVLLLVLFVGSRLRRARRRDDRIADSRED
jgi:hypothetical protein